MPSFADPIGYENLLVRHGEFPSQTRPLIARSIRKFDREGTLPRGRIRFRRHNYTALCVVFLELFHKRDQSFDALTRHRVVDARAHAAHAAMTLQALEPARLRLGDELRV